MKGTFPLNTQPRNGSWGAKSSCASVPTTSEAAQMPSYAARIFFSGSIEGLGSSTSLTPKPEGLNWSLPWCFLPETPGWVILLVCGVEHIFNILSCLYWPKGYCMNYFFFNLFKSLLGVSFKIVLLSGHLIERAYSLFFRVT